MEFLFGPVLTLLVLGGIIAAVVAIIRRNRREVSRKPTEGGDFIAYLLLALAVGVTAFSLAELARVAFPERAFLSGAPEGVATALAGIVVAAPIAILMWRRQERRRARFPRSGGWTVYLSLVEAVFLIAFVVGAAEIVEWLFQGRPRPHWTDAVVFGGVVVFHEWASRRTPPLSDESEAPRVLGSGIGLVSLAIGAGGVLYWALQRLYSTLTPIVTGAELAEPAAIAVVALPIWWYRWLRPWDEDRSAARKSWLAMASVVGLGAAIGALVFFFIQTAAYLFGDTQPAGSHFDFLPTTAAIGIVAILVWAHHIGRIGKDRSDVRRAYEYALAAIGLGGAIGFATTLSAAAFGTNRLVGPRLEVVLTSIISLIAASLVWWVFWSRAARAPRETEARAGARRIYLLGMGVVSGLTAAGALIATLVVLFQNILGSDRSDSVAVQASLFLFAGLATWHLLRANTADRALIASDMVTPFEVTIICSDPGPLEDALPDVADIHVVFRGDDTGVVSEDMAVAIVEAIANTDSIVWVDEDGFRVAPAR